jgi:hypothetical protein
MDGTILDADADRERRVTADGIAPRMQGKQMLERRWPMSPLILEVARLSMPPAIRTTSTGGQ